MIAELTDVLATAKVGSPETETLIAVEHRGTGPEGREQYRWEVWDHGRLIGSGEDLASGAGGVGGKPAEMLGALAGFLSAAAEGGDLFSAEVTEWAYLNEDELAMLAIELEGVEL